MYLVAQESALLRETSGSVALDLGYGRVPLTTLEMGRAFWALNPQLRLVGAEIDAERVAAAAPFAGPRVSFRRGGFDVDVGPLRLVRAMNVLRQYDEAAVAPAWRMMGTHLVDGGLLVEGTCDPAGHHSVVHLIRRRDGRLVHEGVLFHTRLTSAFDPACFQPVLPKRLIHRVVPGESVHGFFAAWRASWQESLAMLPFGPRQVFVHTARQLATRVSLDRRRWLARRGYVLWRTGLGWSG